jgi:hypothetical protein
MSGVHCYRRQTIPYTTRKQTQKESKMEVEKPDKCVIRGAVKDFMSLDTRNLFFGLSVWGGPESLGIFVSSP